MDGGVWWAIVRGVAQSRTTEQLNSGSSKSAHSADLEQSILV